MDPAADGRPTTRGGTRLGTSAGSRPTTGRPGTSAGGAAAAARPTTAGGRPRTAARTTTADGRPTTRAGGGGDEYLEDWDEEDYESEDDGDVFAFVPPDLGPSPANITANPLDAFGQPVDAAAAAAGPSNVTPPSVAAAPPPPIAEQDEPDEQEETFYFDESTGAVYDAQGRLVEMPAGFDVAALTSGGGERPRDVSIAMPSPHIEQVVAASSSRHSLDPRYSTDRKSSDASTVGAGMAPLTLARSNPALDALSEVDYLPTSRDGSSRRRSSARDIGTTASGRLQIDSTEPGAVQSASRSAGAPSIALDGLAAPAQLRQRNAGRLSYLADTARSPDYEVRKEYGFDGDGASIGAKGESVEQLGMGDGLAHGVLTGVKLNGNGIRMVELEMDQEEDSPYPEVRASVSNIDDPTMPAMTLRMWILALIVSSIAGGANVFFNFRYPAPSVSSVIVQLVTYPLGRLAAAIMPIRVFQLPRFLGGARFSFNPGAFNIKEHALIYILANVTIGQSYALNLIIATDSPYYYDQPRSLLFAVLFVISSQLVGFGLSGMCRRFLVRPASMIWPQNLVTATILNTLHADDDDGLDGTMTRFRWFSLVATGAFVWYFFPGFIFNALQQFNWLCWIFPTSHVVNTVFGVSSGMGLSVLTFDWSQIQYVGSPLVYPWWAQCNIFAGFVTFVCVISPALWFSNVWYFGHLPFSSSGSYDRFGKPYDVLAVVGPDLSLDRAKYEAYSNLYLSPTYFIVFWCGFATFTSLIVHTALYHGKTLWRGLKNMRTEEDDIHAKLMRSYPEVPDWWYGVILVSCFVLAIVVIEVYNTALPIWGLVVSLCIPIIYVLPAGFIFAMTGSAIGTNLIGEFIGGYALPGRPIANMIFKTYTTQTLSSALNFIQDLKVGHYLKVPPRATFAVQVFGSLWICFVQIGVKSFMFAHVDDICSPLQSESFTCPHVRVFYTSSIVWGAIGPARMFTKGAIYSSIYWAMLAGAIAPVPLWLLARKFPKSGWKFASAPIFFTGSSFIPPATGINYTSWFLMGFIFQYLLRKYNFRWWSKYNFVTSAALDFGTITSSIVIFFVLQLPRGGSLALDWWGNAVFRNTYDYQGTPLYETGPEGFTSQRAQA